MVAVNKYVTLFNLSWQNGLVYRVQLLLWRFRQIITTMMALTIWTVIFAQQSNVFGYTRGEMTSYVLIASFLQSLILASSLHSLSGDIYSGNISQHLLKPARMFMTFATLEAADKARNVLFSIVEAIILVAIFKPTLIWPSWETWGVFLIWAALGTVIHFYITILFGTLGFWSPQNWAPKFLFFMVLDFTAGKIFPLDIFPELVQKIVWLTPFPYLTYIQTQLFVGRIAPESILNLSLGLLFWTIFFWQWAAWQWRRGVRSYEGAGQ